MARQMNPQNLDAVMAAAPMVTVCHMDAASLAGRCRTNSEGRLNHGTRKSCRVHWVTELLKA